jgi:hypothetical protein
MSEIWTLVLVDFQVPWNAHIIVGLKVTSVYVYEQSMMINNDHVIHCIDPFSMIKPNLMDLSIPQFLDFNQIVVDETNTTWQLCNSIPKLILSLDVGH